MDIHTNSCSTDKDDHPVSEILRVNKFFILRFELLTRLLLFRKLFKRFESLISVNGYLRHISH